MKSQRHPMRRILLLVWLALLAGCSAGQGQAQLPTLQASPTAAPGPTSAPAASATLPAGGPDNTPLPDGAPYVRIQNHAQGVYLYEQDGKVLYGNPASDEPSAQWLIEDYQGSKRIRNRATGHYMAIEHLRDHVESIPVEDVWMSSRWTLEPGPLEGSTIIRNVWHSWEVLHLEGRTGALQYGRLAGNAQSGTWRVQGLDGAVAATSTPRPAAALPTPAAPAGSRGATVPWIEYEAEEGQTNGELLGPSRLFGEIAAESSGRRAVRLDATGEYLELSSSAQANSIVLRYVIPDSPEGDGITTTLSLYVDGAFRQKLSLTSRFAWSYGGEANTANQPALGGAHHFYDEARALVGDIPAGATLRLQKDAGDSAEYYVLDLVDLEQVAPALEMPKGYLSILECGATPDDGTDDGPAIQRCIDQARAQGMGVWIPPGIFESTSVPLTVSQVTIRGAGMWHSTIHGFYARFNCAGDGCRYHDFAILGETTMRDDKSPENGFNGSAGSGSLLENIWVEHTKVGYWVGGGAGNSTSGLLILNSRFRNLFADGVNLCNGASYSLVEGSHFRNTGDDALASWSPSFGGGGVNTGNVFRFNTVQLPWRANCFAIYGGKDNAIQDNLCFDVVTYPGILIAQDFDSHPFEGTTRIQRNSLVRAGGPMFRQEHGALKLRAVQGDISGVLVEDLLIESPTFSGIHVEGRHQLSAASLREITIVEPGSYGIYLTSNAAGELHISEVSVSSPAKEGLLNYAPASFFTLTRGEGNSGW